MTISRPVEPEKNLPSGSITPWMWIRAVIVIGGIPALALFLPAWTVNWPMGWIYIVISLIFFAGSRVIVARVHPDTLVERGKMLNHPDAKPWDRTLSLYVGMLGPLSMYVVSGLVYRFGWGADVPLWAQLSALVVYIVGYILGSWALVTNRFFSGVVRIQTDRGHTVVSNGPYAIVRHPGYSSAAFSYLATPIMLGAYWALIPALATLVLLVIRTVLEDRTLHTELPGYKEYAQKTRYRLIPGIW